MCKLKFILFLIAGESPQDHRFRLREVKSRMDFEYFVYILDDFYFVGLMKETSI